jgi:transforming growth factor-beta-induced protein
MPVTNHSSTKSNTMNKVRFFLSALVIGSVVTFSSCSEEEEEEVPALPNIVEIAQGNEDFSILVQALTREDLTINFVELLTSEGPFTVFAPTNAAFAALLVELTPEGQPTIGLGDIPVATLEAVLQYHVVAGAAVKAGDLTEGQVVSTALAGETFTIGLAGGAKITDANDRMANIILTDVEASNGVVHAIDKVILPTL